MIGQDILGQVKSGQDSLGQGEDRTAWVRVRRGQGGSDRSGYDRLDHDRFGEVQVRTKKRYIGSGHNL